MPFETNVKTGCQHWQPGDYTLTFNIDPYFNVQFHDLLRNIHFIYHCKKLILGFNLKPAAVENKKRRRSGIGHIDKILFLLLLRWRINLQSLLVHFVTTLYKRAHIYAKWNFTIECTCWNWGDWSVVRSWSVADCSSTDGRCCCKAWRRAGFCNTTDSRLSDVKAADKSTEKKICKKIIHFHWFSFII